MCNYHHQNNVQHKGNHLFMFADTHTRCKITKRGMLIVGDVDDASSCPYELITEASGTPDLSPALDPSIDLSAEPAPPFLFPPLVDSYVYGVCGQCEGE